MTDDPRAQSQQSDVEWLRTVLENREAWQTGVSVNLIRANSILFSLAALEQKNAEIARLKEDLHGGPALTHAMRLERNAAKDALAEAQIQAATARYMLEDIRRWHKVSDGLPVGKCMAFYVNEAGKGRTIMARYHKAKTVETSGEYDDVADVADYDEATDTYYLTEGWWEQVENGGDDITEWLVPDGDSKITHWREIGPLPVEALRAPQTGGEK